MSAVARLVTPQQVSLEDACEAWLATFCGPEQRSTRIAYGKAADALLKAFDCGVSELDADNVATWFSQRFGQLAPAAWNLRLAALKEACSYWQRQGWLHHDPLIRIERRKPAKRRDRAFTPAEAERLLASRKASLRDRLLWVMLAETGMRASEALSIDVAEIDLANHCVRVVIKGGDTHLKVWQARSAGLLTRYLDGRTTGPLFLTERAACVQLAPCDIDPSTGRARLSYRRAQEIFSEISGGESLHRWRHTKIRRLLEANVPAPVVMALSGHASLRSLEPYAHVGDETVRALQANTDPARRKAW